MYCTLPEATKAKGKSLNTQGHRGYSRQFGESNLLWVNQRHEGQLLIVFCIWSGQLHYIVFEECLDRSVLPELSQVTSWTRRRGYRGRDKHCDSWHCSTSTSVCLRSKRIRDPALWRRSSRTVDAPLLATVTTHLPSRQNRTSVKGGERCCHHYCVLLRVGFIWRLVSNI